MLGVCLTCSYWRATKPKDWSPRSKWDEWDGNVYSLRVWLADRDEEPWQWSGECWRFPEHTPVAAQYGCGEHSVAEAFVDSRDFFTKFEQGKEFRHLKAEVKRLKLAARELRIKLRGRK